MRWKCLPIAFSLFVVACGTADQPMLQTDPYENWSPDAQYIGKEACGECHKENYQTFLTSQMGRSFRPAVDSMSQADWTDDTAVYDPGTRLWYQPVRRGENLFIREFRLAGDDTVHNRVEQISWIIGSGQHTNSHIREINGYLYQMPLTYYIQARKWGLPPGFDGGDSPRFNRPIPDLCMSCHTGPSDYVRASENRFTYVPHGIECENCHGPGSIHQEAARTGRVVDITTQIDPTIVHPGKLPVDRLDDVCQKCHMQGAAVDREGKTPFDFRPGQRLTDFVDVFWPRFADSAKTFIMASHPDRLRMSACFRASRDDTRGLPAMTCITCHNPHKPVRDKSRDEYNAPCRACHARPDLPKCGETLEIRQPSGDDCSLCHMPESGTLDIPNIHITDHFIRVDRPVPVPETPFAHRTDLVRMASLLRDSLDLPTMAEGYLSYYETWAHRPFYLDSAAAVLSRADPAEPGYDRVQIRLLYLQEEYDRIRQKVRERTPADENDAWTAYRIGEAWDKGEFFGRATSWFERTVQLAPDQLRFKDRLGSAYMGTNRSEEAMRVFDQILAADPTLFTTRNNRGFALLLQGNIEAAESEFREAVRLSPDYPEALGNLSSLLFNTGRRAEALPFARRLVALDPRNEQYREFLRAIMAPAG